MKPLSVLKNLTGKRILVIGDLILDCYIWGRVNRISPEAPVPVVEVERDSYMLGGAANVASNIVSLGGKATVLGAVGKDRAAGTVEDLMKAQGIDYIAVEDPRRPTTMKTRVIAHHQQVVRFDREDPEKLTASPLAKLMEHIKKEIPRHDAVVISDYKKGIVQASVIKQVIKSAGRTKFVSVDPKVGHFHLYKGVSLITPNLHEASVGSGVEITDEKSLHAAGKKLRSSLGLEAALITRGEGGMSLFKKDEVIHIPTLARKVFDVTGAGDTVIAMFTLARAAGASLEEAAVLANHAAGIVVGEVGAATTTIEAVRESLDTTPAEIERQKI